MYRMPAVSGPEGAEGDPFWCPPAGAAKQAGDTCHTAHGCPPFLIERAFRGMLFVKRENKEDVGSLSMDERQFHERRPRRGMRPGGMRYRI